MFTTPALGQIPQEMVSSSFFQLKKGMSYFCFMLIWNNMESYYGTAATEVVTFNKRTMFWALTTWPSYVILPPLVSHLFLFYSWMKVIANNCWVIPQRGVTRSETVAKETTKIVFTGYEKKSRSETVAKETISAWSSKGELTIQRWKRSCIPIKFRRKDLRWRGWLVMG